jgi:hypothetical protein
MPKLSKSSNADINKDKEKDQADKHSVIMDESVADNTVAKQEAPSANARKPENKQAFRSIGKRKVIIQTQNWHRTSCRKRRTTNNSINEEHDMNCFHSRLMDSMEEAERFARRTSTDNKLESNLEEYTQSTKKLDDSNVPSESNSNENVQKCDETNTSIVPTELAVIEETHNRSGFARN